MTVTLERLRLLHAVSVHGTITAAAAQAGYTASAVSQQLSALERDLATALLERSNRGVTLTPAGARLSQRAAQILDLVQTATTETTHTGPDAPPMTIRVGAFPTAISSIIVPAMASLKPLAELVVVHLEPEQALAALTSRRLEAAVVDFYPSQPASSSWAELHQVTLLSDPLHLALRSDRPEPASLAELAQTPWVLADAQSRLGRAARAILATAGFEPQVVVETDDHRVTFDVMNTIDAATILPGLALRSAPAHVCPAPLNLATDRRINLVTRSILRTHPAFTALETALRTTASHT